MASHLRDMSFRVGRKESFFYIFRGQSSSFILTPSPLRPKHPIFKFKDPHQGLPSSILELQRQLKYTVNRSSVREVFIWHAAWRAAGKTSGCSCQQLYGFPHSPTTSVLPS